MADVPTILGIDEKDLAMYKQLKSEEMFKNTERKEQFLMAVVMGFKNRTKRPISKYHSGGYVRVEYLKPEDEALLAAIALYDTGSENVLSEKKQVYRIAEEYAHAGIKILNDMITDTQFGDFAKHFEKVLLDAYAELMPVEEEETEEEEKEELDEEED